MIGQLIRPELARAWENYFGIRGGETPGAMRDVIAAIVLDSNPPWAPFRHWHAGILGTAGAGNYNYVGITNRDDPAKQVGSIVVVDYIAVKNITAAVEIVVGLGNVGNPPNIAYGDVNDADSGKEPSTTGTDPGIQNIGIGGGQDATAGLIRAQYPGGAIGATVIIPGPFMLRPKGELLLAPNQLAAQIHVWVRGRYYPAI